MGGSLSDEPLKAFGLSIMRQLDRRGVPVTPQYGVAGYRLDFACGHPEQPGRVVLAIRANGAAYHSTPTAGDRDQLVECEIVDSISAETVRQALHKTNSSLG